MKQLRPKRAVAPTHPLWKRWAAMLALVMAAVLGTAEAAHIHGDWLPHNRHEVHSTLADGNGSGSEENCPICVAMHSTLPTLPVLHAVPVVLDAPKVVVLEVSAPAARWHFAMFSRPPPALL